MELWFLVGLTVLAIAFIAFSACCINISNEDCYEDQIKAIEEWKKKKKKG